MKKVNFKQLPVMRLLLSLALIFLGIAFRTVWHLAPNVEFVTTASLLAARYLGFLGAVSVPLLIMFISDMAIGNAKIYLFTWSAYIFIGLSGLLLKRWKTPSKLILAAGFQSIAASFFFFFYTNFGVWLLDEWGMYPKTLAGLLRCYYMGLPFLKLNLLGNLIFTPISFMVLSSLSSVIKASLGTLFRFRKLLASVQQEGL